MAFFVTANGSSYQMITRKGNVYVLSSDPVSVADKDDILQLKADSFFSEVASDQLVAQFSVLATQIQFIDEPFDPPTAELSQVIEVAVTSGTGGKISLCNALSVTVGISGGTATGKKLRSADGSVIGTVDSSIVVPVVNGSVLIVAEAGSVGTMDLSLTDSDSTGLATIDTATVTFS